MIAVAACAAGLVAGALTLARVRRLPDIGRCDDDARDRWAGAVSVVVPARDEATTLPALLRSVGAAGQLVREVIVVDDNSADATSAVAADLGATVLRLDGDPPPGWTGKSHACARGAELAQGRLLLFLDADVVLGVDAVARLVGAHAAEGGLVSVQPFHAVSDPYEELSAVCNLMSMMGCGAFAPWSTRARPAAFGPCLMTGVDDYRRVGGHAAVRGEVIEDIALAQRYAAHGLAVRVFAGGDALSFRMYPGGVRQLVDGWTKNLALGSRAAHPVAVIAAAAWLTASLTIGVSAIATIVRFRTVSSLDTVVAILGWLTVASQMRWMLARVGRFRRLTAFVHPVPLWSFVALFVRSVWRTGVRRSVRWRGRRIELRPGSAS